MDLMILIAVGGLVLYKFYVMARSKPDSLACLEAGETKPPALPSGTVRGSPYRGHDSNSLGLPRDQDYIGNEIELPEGEYEVVYNGYGRVGDGDFRQIGMGRCNGRSCVLYQDSDFAYAKMLDGYLSDRNSVVKIPLGQLHKVKVLSTLEQRELYQLQNKERLESEREARMKHREKIRKQNSLLQKEIDTSEQRKRVEESLKTWKK